MSRSRWRLVVASTAPLGLVVVMWWRWPTIRAGLVTLGRADHEWIVLAATASATTWLAATSCLLGATTTTLPVSRVLAVQVAGSFINHILPAGVGAAGLNMRMLSRCGLSRARAGTAIGLNFGAGAVVHILALVCLGVAQASSGLSPTRMPVLSISGVTVAVIVCLATYVALKSKFIRTRLKDYVAMSRDVLSSPRHAAMLWLGSGAIPALHVLTLLAVLNGLRVEAPVVPITLSYLGASAVSALIPTPGGFGGLDIALVAALSAEGLTGKTAVGAVIGYRLLTVWIPLLPGAGSFAILVKRHAI